MSKKVLKSLFLIIFIGGILIAGFCGCKNNQPDAIIKTNMGDISINFYSSEAPKAVKNFKTHSRNKYYDGLTFHRVIDNFMIQGGDPTGDGTGGESIWKEPFEDEFSDKALHYRGALAMSNRGPNTNGSQFFIVQNKGPLDDGVITQSEMIHQKKYSDKDKERYKKEGGTPHLDGIHTVFAYVIDGFDVLDKIASQPVDENDKPLKDIIIKTIEIKK